MITLSGTGFLIRLIVRRDRICLPIWVAALVGIFYASAGAVGGLYVTPEEIAAYAATMGRSPAAIATAGPPVALTTPGGITVFETTLTALVGVALMAVFTVMRHTRAEEEYGRTEMLCSAAVGRAAPLAAALLVACSASVAVGALSTAALVAAVDVPTVGAVVYGAAIAAAGVVFAAVAAVAAQLTSHARAAVGLSLTMLGLAYALRAIGDVHDNAASWLSPIGWSQQVRAFADNRWWPLALSLALTGILVGIAVTVAARRDLGAALVQPRPGPASAARSMSGGLGLIWRLQRSSVAAWTMSMLALGLTFGSFSREFESLISDNPDLAAYFAQTGGSLTDAFFATVLLLLALLGGAHGVSFALRIRTEENSGRLDHLLATGLSRTRLMAAHLAVTLCGTTVVVAAGGLGVGAANTIVSDQSGSPADMVIHALTYLPAAFALTAVAVALIGWAPRVAPAAWAAAAACFVIGWLGVLLDIPDWLAELSPYTHTPEVPLEAVTATPLATVAGAAAAMFIIGVAGFRHRDIH